MALRWASFGCVVTMIVAGAQSQEPAVDAGRFYAATIAAAEKAIRLNEIGEARKWLQEAPEPARGWEWSYLSALADESRAAWETPGPRVTSVDVSSEANLLVTADISGVVTVRRLSDFQEQRRIAAHTDAVYEVCFAPDRKRILTVSRDQSSRVFDVSTGAEISKIPLDNPGVAAAAFSPDGSLAATCTWLRSGDPPQVHGVVWVWDPATGTVLHRTLVAEHPLDSLVWTPDGQHLLVGCWDGSVSILTRDGELVDTVHVPEDEAYSAVISVAVSPDGAHFACGSKDCTARVWRWDNRELVSTLSGHTGFVTDLSFTDDGKELVTASTDGTLRHWNIVQQRSLAILRGHTSSVDALAITDDGNQVFSAARDGSVRSWDLSADFDGGRRVRLGAEGSYTVTPSPNGRDIYIAMYDGRVIVLDAATGTVAREWTAHEGSTCNTLALSADGRRVLTCSWDKTARLWDAAEHRLLVSISCDAGIYGCAVSPDGSLAALWVGSDAEIHSTDDGRLVHRLTGHTGAILDGKFAADGRTLATASADGTVRLWDMADGRSHAVLEGHQSAVHSVAFRGPGAQLASGDALGVVRLWETAAGECRGECQAGTQTVQSLHFSHDGTRLAAGSGRVSIIDPETATALLHFTAQPDSIYRLAFMPDDSQMISCTTGGSIAFSDSRPRAVRARQPFSSPPGQHP